MCKCKIANSCKISAFLIHKKFPKSHHMFEPDDGGGEEVNNFAVVDALLMAEFRRMLLHESKQQAANQVEEASIDRQVSLESNGGGRMAGQPEMANPFRVVLVFAEIGEGRVK